MPTYPYQALPTPSRANDNFEVLSPHAVSALTECSVPCCPSGLHTHTSVEMVMSLHQAPRHACIGILHIWALRFVHIGHRACVSSCIFHLMVKYDLHHISPSSDDVLSAYSLELALVLCTSQRCTGTWAHMLSLQQCTSVTRYIASHEAVIKWYGTDCVFPPCCLSQQPPYARCVTTSSTQICLHWCYAHRSSVLGLGRYAVVAVRISQICTIWWSSDRWAGLRRVFIAC